MTPTPRQLARENTMREIVRIGRAQLDEVGPAALSLRAVARELGIVSSAVYRYVKNRDELLTLLIVDAYDDLADHVDAARKESIAFGEGTAARSRTTSARTHLHAVANAVRTWAKKEPSRYALLYGTPVPGYAAPAERTTEPGIRVVLTLMDIATHGIADGTVATPERPLPPHTESDMERIRTEFDIEAPAAAIASFMHLWSGLFGLVSFEVFGQWGPDTITDPEEFFAHQVDLLADAAGFE